MFDKIYTVDNSSFPDIPGTLLIRCAGIIFTKYYESKIILHNIYYPTLAKWTEY